VLAGTFMRFDCIGCRATIEVEHDLLYSDLERQLFIGVFPRPSRGDAASCANLIEETFRTTFLEAAPAPVRRSATAITRRIVFGYDELREKVVARDAGLDDRVVEALKLVLIQDAGWKRGSLLLDAVDEDRLRFARITGVGVEPVSVARGMYQELVSEQDRLAILLAPLFDGPYVHVSRCMEAA